MTTPAGAQVVTTAAIGVVVALMLIGALYLWRRTGSPAGLLVLLGGFLCSLNEEVVDVLGLCWFPADGWIVHEMWDRPIPLWAVVAYGGFFGGLTYINVLAMQRGAGYRTMWLALGGVWLVNLILEIPILAAGLYVYYGDQPYRVAGFPLNWLVINALGAMLAAVVIHRLGWVFTGARQLLLLAVPFVTYMASWVLAMPHFGALNSDVPSWVRWAGSTVSLLLSLYALDCLIRIGVGRLSFGPNSAAGVAVHRASSNTDRKDPSEVSA